METVFLSLIQQLNGSVFTLIIILVIVIWLAHKSGSWIQSYKNFETKSTGFDAKIDSIKESIFKVQATTDLLYQTHLSTVQAHSPISLTERGKKISTDISAESKITNHWESIKKELDKKNPANPYDVQTVSMDISRNCFETIFTREEQDQVKTYAYGIGMNLLEIYPIFGVIIRDKVFEEQNIKPEEVDKHDPKNPK